MKNTKHNEFLDQNSSNPEISSSKRKILTSLGVSSGILGASALSQHWVKPVVNSVILPAHAQTTPTTAPPTTMAPTTMAPTTTEAPATTTTEAPATTTTEAPAVPAILVAPMALGVVMRGATNVSQTFQVSLATMPAAPVVVTATSSVSGSTFTGTGASVTFTTTSWNVPQLISYQDTTEAPDSMANESTTPSKVTFTASGNGSGYEKVKAEATYTIGYFGNAGVTGQKATPGAVGTRSATVTWAKPKTRATVVGYRVSHSSDSTDNVATQTVTTESATFKGLGVATDHTFSIVALYPTGTTGGADSTAASTAAISIR